MINQQIIMQAKLICQSEIGKTQRPEMVWGKMKIYLDYGKV